MIFLKMLQMIDQKYNDINLLCVGSGHLLGDSLGAQYEFRFNKSRCYKRDFAYVPRTISRYQGERYGVLGQWTDDTEMSLCILRSLQKTDFEYNIDSVLHGYLQWANSKPFGMGKTTRTLLYGIKTNKGYYKRLSKLKTEDSPILESQSNGSLMRAWVLAFAKNSSCVEEDCKITNNNPVNIECNVIYVKMIKDLLNNCYDASQLKSSNPIIQCAIDDARSNKKRTFKEKESGWVVHALYFAILASISELHPLETYDYIINMRIDPDTTGAIAGAVIGARHGKYFLESAKDLLKIILECDTTQGAFPRSDIYHPKFYLKQN